MQKDFAHMKLKKKLDVGYAMVIVVMIISGIFSIIGLGILYNNLNSYINGPQRADTAVKICRIDINIAARNIREMAMNTDESTYSEYRATVNDILSEAAGEIEALKNSGAVSETLVERYETALTTWGEIADSIMNDIENGDNAAAVSRILNECAPALDEVVEISKEIDAETDEKKTDSINFSRYTTFGSIIFIIIFIVAAAVISAKLGKKIINFIVPPIQQMEAVVKGLSEGNIHSELAFQSEDELGDMAGSLKLSVKTLGEYINDIGRVMGEFSDGNFDVQPEVDWKGDFVSILDAFMSFEKKMAETVQSIRLVAEQVKNGSDQVSASSMELATGATEQAGITADLAATISDISGHVSENAEHAKDISKRVEDAGVEIDTSNGKMQEMVHSMSEINNASREISKIIATINDIASQTNLLALNASIEAARAGDAGKGFAVVADQVSVLAAQSAQAAKESTVLIETSVNAVEKGMVIADDTAKHLENVVASSKAIMEEVNKVASALEEQTLSIARINEGVDHINDVVQTNSATSEECAAASQEMNGQAAVLENLIRGFKVGKF